MNVASRNFYPGCNIELYVILYHKHKFESRVISYRKYDFELHVS